MRLIRIPRAASRCSILLGMAVGIGLSTPAYAVWHSEDGSLEVRGFVDNMTNVRDDVGLTKQRVQGQLELFKQAQPRGIFSDLSMGERWRIVVDLAADAVGVGGMFTIPQEAWEALDPINRDAVAAHVKRRGVIVITAEATAAEGITAATYQPQSEGNDDAIGQT